MTALMLTTFGVSVASALVPLINIELYLGGLGTQVDVAWALPLGIVAGLGQSVGKIVWYEATRRGMETAWVQRRLTPLHGRLESWQARLHGRPWWSGTIMFLSAFGGIPPLLVMAAVAGALRMPRWVFLPTIFLGRALRFWLLLAGVGLFFD